MPLVDDPSLDDALSEGVLPDLPPNVPPGFLGETAPDLRKPQDWQPDGNAGLSQENDLPVVLMSILLAYLLFFPLAYVILIRTHVMGRRAKWALGGLMATGLLAVAGALLT